MYLHGVLGNIISPTLAARTAFDAAGFTEQARAKFFEPALRGWLGQACQVEEGLSTTSEQLQYVVQLLVALSGPGATDHYAFSRRVREEIWPHLVRDVRHFIEQDLRSSFAHLPSAGELAILYSCVMEVREPSVQQMLVFLGTCRYQCHLEQGTAYMMTLQSDTWSAIRKFFESIYGNPQVIHYLSGEPPAFFAALGIDFYHHDWEGALREAQQRHVREGRPWPLGPELPRRPQGPLTLRRLWQWSPRIAELPWADLMAVWRTLQLEGETWVDLGYDLDDVRLLGLAEYYTQTRFVGLGRRDPNFQAKVQAELGQAGIVSLFNPTSPRSAYNNLRLALQLLRSGGMGLVLSEDPAVIAAAARFLATGGGLVSSIVYAGEPFTGTMLQALLRILPSRSPSVDIRGVYTWAFPLFFIRR